MSVKLLKKVSLFEGLDENELRSRGIVPCLSTLIWR